MGNTSSQKCSLDEKALLHIDIVLNEHSRRKIVPFEWKKSLSYNFFFFFLTGLRNYLSRMFLFLRSYFCKEEYYEKLPLNYQVVAWSIYQPKIWTIKKELRKSFSENITHTDWSMKSHQFLIIKIERHNILFSTSSQFIIT